MNKFIFLDIDGVLNNDKTKARTPLGEVGIDNKLVQKLAQLVKTTDARIILSSDWRFYAPSWFYNIGKKTIDETWSYLVGCLAEYNLRIDNITPYYAKEREQEIIMFLADKMPCQYVILDDSLSNEFSFLSSHFVHINPTVGLTWNDVKEAQEKMNVIDMV